MSSVGPEPGRPRPVELQTVFELLPSSVKGAFVLKGADGNPHAVRVRSARICRVPQGVDKPVSVEDRLLDVAPTTDLFVPFEVNIGELPPSWYIIESVLQVDVAGSWNYASPGFTIPWPRTEIRRGSILVGRTATAGGSTFVVERVELNPDSSWVAWRKAQGGGRRDDVPPAGRAVLLADDAPLEVLPPSIVPRSGWIPAPGEAQTISYPLPRSTRRLAVAVVLDSGEESEPIELDL